MANPVLVGAVATLVVIVGVVLAYNANDGLPFVPTYDVEVVVPDAAQLLPGNDVRIGGTRVGVVKRIDVEPSRSGRTAPVARIAVSLEQAVSPLPSDSRAMVRQRSNLGLKFLEITPGRSPRPLPAGGTIPLRQTTGVVDLDDVLSTFDPSTRRALRGAVRELGGGLTGRGPDLNRAIEEAGPPLRSLRSVADNLADPATDVRRFLRSAGSFAAVLAPEAQTLVGLLRSGARTFEAIDQERAALDLALRRGPSTVAVATQGFRDAGPLFTEVEALLADARPALRLVRPAGSRLRRGLDVSGRVLASARPTLADAGGTVRSLTRLSRDPSTRRALQGLTLTAEPLDRALQTITPFQTACNYLGLWGRNVPEVISEGDRLGTWFRFIPIVQLAEELQSARPAPELHADPDPDTGAGGECEPGNQTYVPGQQLDGSAAREPLKTEDTAPPREAQGR